VTFGGCGGAEAGTGGAGPVGAGLAAAVRGFWLLVAPLAAMGGIHGQVKTEDWPKPVSAENDEGAALRQFSSLSSFFPGGSLFVHSYSFVDDFDRPWMLAFYCKWLHID
jgi:hypothetical protein